MTTGKPYNSELGDYEGLAEEVSKPTASAELKPNKNESGFNLENSGEWTVEQDVDGFWHLIVDGRGFADLGEEPESEATARGIVNAHKSALAAEREKATTVSAISDARLNARDKLIRQLSEQLAAEREAHSEASKLALEQLSSEWQTYKDAMEDLRQQLAAEREKTKEAEEAANHNADISDSIARASQQLREQLDMVTREVVVEKRNKQPLVDALHKLAMRVLQSDSYLQAKEETDAAIALAKAGVKL